MSGIRRAVFLGLLAWALAGCSWFSTKTRYEAQQPLPLDVSPWRIIDRAPVGTPGGTLRVSEFGSDPKTFNPITANEQSSLDIIYQCFSALLDTHFKTGKAVDGLAHRWESSPDGKVWTVYLRKGLKWSDGQPLTADDVIFTFKAVYDPKVDNPNRDIAQLRGKPFKVEKISHSTVRFTLPGTYGPFPFALSSVFIVPKHKLEKALENGTFSAAYGVNTPPDEIVSSGAFRVKQYVSQQRVVLERNPYFYAKDKAGQRLPYLDRIVVLYVPDMNTQFLKFRSGEVDAFTQFPPKFYDEMKSGEKAGDYHVVELGPRAETQFFVFNQNPESKMLPRTKLKWFSNRLFRLAVAYGFNRDNMIRLAHLGHGYKVTQDFHPSSPFYNRNVKPFPYDPEKSRTLLKQAGFVWKDKKLYDAEGNRVQFSAVTNSGNVERRIRGEIFKEDLAKLGVDVDFHPIDFNVMISKLTHTFDWEVIEIGLGDTGGSIEPSNDQNLWLSSGFTHQWYPRQKKPATPWEAEIDKLVWEGLGTADFGKRKKIYSRIQEILYREQVPQILTTVPADLYAFRNFVGNADPTPVGRFWYLCPDDMLMAQVYIKKSASP